MKYVYRFSEGNSSMADLLGGKGANLADMAQLGLPVPPGFTITTEACRDYYRHDRQLPNGLWDEIRNLVGEVERTLGRPFGSVDTPLLISVRSGSRYSMPGMMDTILNLGLNDETVEGLARETGDRRFALDSYRRFVQMFAKVALHLDHEPFEEALAEARQRCSATSDAELDEDSVDWAVLRFQEIAGQAGDGSFPSDPWEQLRLAVLAVLDSWNNRRAIAYRRHHNIPDNLGTAVTIQAMVFGNRGWDSGTGVAFSRNPATGERSLYGEYLANAQGEDIVSGARTPKPIEELANDMPKLHWELTAASELLERHHRDLQDIEFTIESGKLYILQTRSAKRTAAAAVKAAVDMADEGMIERSEALCRVPAADLAQLLLPRFQEAAKRQALAEGRLLGRGLNASPGAATGRVVFDADAAASAAGSEPTILVRRETSAEDIHGIIAAAAVLTGRGGVTSHAAVVTRGMGKPAVVGCTDLHIDPARRRMSANGIDIDEGDIVSVDGFTGEVFTGAIETVSPNVAANVELSQLLAWADEVPRRLGVRANADTPADARQALSLGAEGIGLCRTEHMFFQRERLPFVRAMLTAARDVSEMERAVEEAQHDLEEARGEARAAIQERLRSAEERLAGSPQAQQFREALDRLAQHQRQDFAEILRAMDGRPVTIRLLDAPLHEFLPPFEDLLQEVAVLRATGADANTLTEKESMLETAKALHETNPMMGHRGCRLGLTYPDIYEMQVRAIVEAACQLGKEGLKPRPEIMIPMVVDAAELHALKARLQHLTREFEACTDEPAPIHFGTMIELPRAALTAGELAPEVDFFSFGSNDLTQMTFGFSRDDAEEKFLSFYLSQRLLSANPFNTLDEAGVGRLITIAAEEGRRANPKLQLGLCGEHGGDPASIRFCHRAGLDYVSCSPLRVPIARLATAQAALGNGQREDV
ncbi:MAG: pyruvate, phosphate dikinase [Chloroflexi bacterium]|nr:pyruvate, phosphate dikinase [Chloroflexota bacterium]